MVEILSHLYQYIPIREYTESYSVPGKDSDPVSVPKACIHPILIGGDQLTANRARCAIRAKVNEETPALRLEGLIPVAEDWHTKLNFLDVSYNYIHVYIYSYIAIVIFYLYTTLCVRCMPCYVYYTYHAYNYIYIYRLFGNTFTPRNPVLNMEPSANFVTD